MLMNGYGRFVHEMRGFGNEGDRHSEHGVQHRIDSAVPHLPVLAADAGPQIVAHSTQSFSS